MRVFAGPNGSGKSSLKTLLSEPLLGVYLNPDDLEAAMKRDGGVNLSTYGFDGADSEALDFIRNSSFLNQSEFGDKIDTMSASGDGLFLGNMPANSYLASVLVDFLRQKLLTTRQTFTFETVMSHQGKVELLEQARKLGYRTYLYFVATDDPEINISRVASRVRLGGHPVPPDKISERYRRSLGLLLEAIRHTDRAYIFDNSGEGTDHALLAEITNGDSLELKVDEVPVWFANAVSDKLARE